MWVKGGQELRQCRLFSSCLMQGQSRRQRRGWMNFLMLNGYWFTVLITNPWVRRLENYIPSRAYYENPARASNDILRAKTSLWSWPQGIESSLWDHDHGFTVNVSNRMWIISLFSPYVTKFGQYKSISFIIYNKSNLIYSHFLSKTLSNLSKNATMCYYSKSYL